MNILFYDMGSYLYDDILDALKSMGHTVRTAYYHFDNRYEDDFFVDRFTRKLREKPCDIIFSVNFFPLVAVIAHDHDIPYVSWSCDSPLAKGLEDYFDYDTNRIWLFDRAEVETYHKKGHSNVLYSPLAVNTRRVKKVIEDGARSGALNKYKADVSFVGSLYNASLEGLIAPLDDYLKGYIEGIMNTQIEFYGTDLLSMTITDDILDRINAQYAALGNGEADTLNRKGLAFAIQKQITYAERVTLIDTLGSMCDMKFYSTKEYPFESNVRFMGPVKYHEQMPLVFAASRLNLCPTLRSIISGIPLRSLDILACDGVLLSNWQPELAEYFTDGEDLIMYTSPEDAVEKAAWYLENEDARARIAGHAQPVLESEFNYAAKLSGILSEFD
ncbi:MAG: glycosyltransferase [Lachnospiraceae bacterium]|nr:glycosyltransferase [Lachnospiraceae bacterium]